MALSILLLFCGFQWDLWDVADRDWFVCHNSDMEAHIVGRLVMSRDSGMFSAGGLTGIGGPDATVPQYPNWDMEFQRKAYFESLPFGAYAPYLSHVGGQGMALGLLDKVVDLSPPDKLDLFHALTSLLSASVLAAVALWFYRETGLAAALVILASMVFSPWLTVFGRNLWWCLWAFYLPMAAMMFFLRRRGQPAGRGVLALGGLVFATFLLKCLFTGYEYVTTAMIMTCVPLVYYAVSRQWAWRAALKAGLAAAAGIFLALAVSVTILCAQIAVVKGSPQAGIDHIVSSFKKRTYAQSDGLPPEYAESLNAGSVQVIGRYLQGPVFAGMGANYVPRQPECFLSRSMGFVRYWHVLALFAAATAVVLWRARKLGDPRRRRAMAALALTAWLSALAPLSWFVIFKSHSYIHTHMNFVTWQMPLTFFGFGLVALAFRTPAVPEPSGPPPGVSHGTGARKTHTNR